ncbi:RraA family protein [Candidatus Latescibacterota bacterium]
MSKIIGKNLFGWITVLIFCVCLAELLKPAFTEAQVFVFTEEELIEYTADNPYDRFPDGRPKIPDELIERARGLSSEEIRLGKGFGNQFEDGFQILHPGKKMVGRAFTVQFMPTRSDVADVAEAKAKERGIERLGNQTVMDMLQPGDIIVVDLFGKKEQGTFVGDNLFYYIMRATDNAGMVLDGSMRDLEGIAKLDMQSYYRHVDPSAIGNVMLTGINIPIRIGSVTVMPGDLVMGDREGITFIPPALLEKVLERADRTHIHDEWTRMKFDERKYKSREIYGSPSDEDLKKEYEEYLERRLEELEKSR